MQFLFYRVLLNHLSGKYFVKQESVNHVTLSPGKKNSLQTSRYKAGKTVRFAELKNN